MDYRGIIIILLASAIWSCRSVKYVPVETVKTDSVYVNKWHRDSVHVRDSVFLLIKGDTVFRDRLKVVYRDKLVTDTSFIERVDTVRVPYPVEIPLSRWQRFKMEAGGIAFGGIIILVLVVVGRLVYKLRK